MTVSSGYGAWLKAPARYTTAQIVGATDAYGDKAITTTNISPLAYKADADAEAVRQASFLAGPIARDNAVVPGQRSNCIGRLIAITAHHMGYETGDVVFVIGAAENDNGTTTLTFLKRA